MATKCRALRCYRRGCKRRGNVDSNRHNSFFYIGWCNATCFGLTRNHLQANETQQKLLCIKVLLPTDTQNNWFKENIKIYIKTIFNVNFNII